MIHKEAVEFAKKKHKGQKRRFSGGEYIEHPLRVAQIVKKYKRSHKINDLISAAILHDTLEDTNTTEEELKNLFGELVASLVKQLTSDEKEKTKQGKPEYLAKIMSDPRKMDSWALIIKLADRYDNIITLMDNNLYEKKDREFMKRYCNETGFILNQIKEKRILSKTQEKLMNAIEEKMLYFKKISAGNIRIAKQKDVNKIVEMINSDPILFGDRDLDYKKYHIEEMITPPHATYIFEVGKEIVGFISGMFYKKAKICEVYHLIVNKSYRKEGTGKRLFIKMEREAKKRGAERIFYYVSKENKLMIKISQRWNYRKGKERIFFSKRLK